MIINDTVTKRWENLALFIIDNKLEKQQKNLELVNQPYIRILQKNYQNSITSFFWRLKRYCSIINQKDTCAVARLQNKNT